MNCGHVRLTCISTSQRFHWLHHRTPISRYSLADDSFSCVLPRRDTVFVLQFDFISLVLLCASAHWSDMALFLWALLHAVRIFPHFTVLHMCVRVWHKGIISNIIDYCYTCFKLLRIWCMRYRARSMLCSALYMLDLARGGTMHVCAYTLCVLC